jgi:large subunit ribosomal protein L29
MAIIKKDELKQMSEQDLNEKLKSLQEELVKINAQIAMGTLPQNPGKIKEIKRTIARIKTLKGGIKKV